MTTKNKLITFISLALVVAISAYTSIHYALRSDRAQEVRYVREAASIVEYYYSQGVPVSFSTVKATLQAIDSYQPVHFSSGPYTREDFIAMVMVESQFNRFAVGTRGEKGLFQIMEAEAKGRLVRQNQYDIYVNTDLAMQVLKDKYAMFPDYRKAMIAYNGYNVDRSGQPQDGYWRKFLKARSAVDVILAKKD